MTPPDNEPEAPARRVLLTPASAVRMRPVRWLWAERLPAGAITLIPGREGIGKSLTLAWLAARITRGQLPGIWHGQPRPVIYAATEDSWAHTIAPRLYAAGADLDMVYRVDIETDGSIDQLTLPRDCEALSAEINRLGVAMLAADPLLSLISSRIDTFKDQQLRTALEPLARLADQTGCAVVGLAHFNKSATTDALNLITGSRAFAAVARAVLAIARDPDADDGSCVLSQAKNNLGRLDLPSLRYVVNTAEVPTDEGPAYVGVLAFTGESERSVTDILTESASGDPHERTQRGEATGWLIDYLTSQGGSALRKDVLAAASAAGVAKATLERAVYKSPEFTSTASGFPRVAVWSLSDNHGQSSATPVASQSPQSPHPPEGDATGATVRQLSDDPHAPSSRSGHLTPVSDPPQNPQNDARCAACGEPMTVIEHGQTTHPTCTQEEIA